jgi:cytochrome c-type biogenesis protein CcmE
MSKKYIFGGGIIVVFLGIMIYLFTQTNISYEADFQKIMASTKTVKATGSWIKERSYQIDKEKNLVVFYMKDHLGTELKVLFTGTLPNNFESSISLVVTGKYKEGNFYATDILTKCPSKYQEQPIQNANN